MLRQLVTHFFLLFASSAAFGRAGLEAHGRAGLRRLPRSAYADGVRCFGGPKMLIFLCNLSEPARVTIGENDAHREICG